MIYCNIEVMKNAKFTVLPANDDKSEGSVEMEAENENIDTEEPEKICIIDPDSEVSLIILPYRH